MPLTLTLTDGHFPNRALLSTHQGAELTVPPGTWGQRSGGKWHMGWEGAAVDSASSRAPFSPCFCGLWGLTGPQAWPQLSPASSSSSSWPEAFLCFSSIQEELVGGTVLFSKPKSVIPLSLPHEFTHVPGNQAPHTHFGNKLSPHLDAEGIRSGKRGVGALRARGQLRGGEPS